MIETVPPGTILYKHYRIERVIGSGGFGHVYLAINLANNQQCAVKEYLVTGANGQEQLKHEANVLRQLHHPSLPAFQDAFIERGRYYVVLSYIEGSDLTDLIRITKQRNEAISIEKTIQWIVSICDAVMFLHNQNPPVIHRDIKPDNIRIMPNGTATLVDLGNAKAAADGARTLFFIRHQGTPGYAPQEQYPGGSGTDTRSDVYALGGTLYFALTAHEPPSVSTRNQAIQQNLPDLPTLQDFLAKNPPEEAADPGRQFRASSNRPAKPAPRHSRQIAQLGAIPPELLKQLNKIIQQAMAMKSKDRYQSVADLEQDLKRILYALPAQQAPKRTPDPHSTQHDLPMLYEAIQAAKEQAAQESSDGGPPQVASRPVPTPIPPVHCPRCNSIVNSQATYCPRCGNNLVPANSQASGPIIKQDVGEQTMIIKPQDMAQQIADHSQKAKANIGTTGPHAQYPAQQQQAMLQSMTNGKPVSNHSTTATHAPPASRVPQSPTIYQQNPVATSQKASFFAIGPRIIILLIVLIFLLILLGAFLLSQSHLHGNAPGLEEFVRSTSLLAHLS